MLMLLNNAFVGDLVRSYGFDLVGFAESKELDIEIERLSEWLDHGYQAGMTYMQRNLDKKKDVKKFLSTAKSVISLGINYYSPDKYSEQDNRGKVSRYAWGKDYHLVIWEKLDKIIGELKHKEPSFEAASYVDTGPVMDKAWAVRSGIGWLGKHTNVIIKEYVVDSNKCISYLTIENKQNIPEEFKSQIENWVFGCDICQDVCPWNIKFSKFMATKEFHPQKGNRELNLDDVLNLTKTEFDKRFSVSPIKRAKLSGLKRNAEFLPSKNES